MPAEIPLTEKYERQGWPSLARPDLKPPTGWSLELATSVPRVYNHSLSPNGEQAAFLWNREGFADVYTLPVRPGVTRWPARISLDRPNKPYWQDEIPCWSPDSQDLAYTSGEAVFVAGADGKPPLKITPFSSGCSSPVWLPDGNSLIVAQEIEDFIQLWKVSRDGTSAERLTRDPGDHRDAWPSPDGKTLIYTHNPGDDFRRSDIHLLKLSTGKVIHLTGTPQQKDWHPRWSPDGAWIAFLSQRSGFNEIWLVSPQGGEPRQLTQAGLDLADPVWSPDGTRIACTVNRLGALHLALVSLADGSLTELAASPGVYSHPSWAPDGNFITVEYEQSSAPPDLYRFDLPAQTHTQLTFSNPPALQALHLLDLEPVVYPGAGGQEIHGLLYRPASSNRAAIVHPHGGPADQYTYQWDIFDQYLAAKGYTILAPNYRGSTGYGVPFEHANYGDWGGGDAQDCLNAATFLANIPGIDPARVGIMGASAGGYLVACCLSRDPEYRLACGVCKFGDASMYSSWALCERGTREYTEMMLGHPARYRKVYQDASPILQVDQVRSPVLVLHGLLDDIVPPETGAEWVEALRKAGKTYEFKTYSGEGHGFLHRATQLDVYRRTERFLDWYLVPDRI
ncbi:MAG TPA: S9 family peptidase [Anaerolineales bacterium]|nr:S9 family peptidase [Anaerolineales bacterium]